MSLVRWDPFMELKSFNERMNDLLTRTPRFDQAMTAADWMPAVDVQETKEGYLIKAELPGIDRKDVKVTVTDRVLTMSGERKKEMEKKDERWHRIERSYGAFVRRFTLPEDVDDKKIHAECKDGVLVVHIPKGAEAKPKAYDIAVK